MGCLICGADVDVAAVSERHKQLIDSIHEDDTFTYSDHEERIFLMQYCLSCSELT